MIANKCLFCGSSRLRADRALSGRLVCTSCGNPYGVRKIVRNKSINVNNLFFNSKTIPFIFLLLLVFFLVII